MKKNYWEVFSPLLTINWFQFRPNVSSFQSPQPSHTLHIFHDSSDDAHDGKTPLRKQNELPLHICSAPLLHHPQFYFYFLFCFLPFSLSVFIQKSILETKYARFECFKCLNLCKVFKKHIKCFIQGYCLTVKFFSNNLYLYCDWKPIWACVI